MEPFEPDQAGITLGSMAGIFTQTRRNQKSYRQKLKYCSSFEQS